MDEQEEVKHLAKALKQVFEFDWKAIIDRIEVNLALDEMKNETLAG